MSFAKGISVLVDWTFMHVNYHKNRMLHLKKSGKSCTIRTKTLKQQHTVSQRHLKEVHVHCTV